MRKRSRTAGVNVEGDLDLKDMPPYAGGLIGVDGLVGLLAGVEVGDELDNAGNRATDERNLVDVGFVNLGVAEDLQSISMEVCAAEERVRLAHSQAVQRRRHVAPRLVERSDV